MIQLKNVSKFYYSKGVIASGFSKVNLEFNIGEFVAITGESGSGKSTLLNVISGLDTYEEGEMYINGEETSHYTEKDFEDYRRKYIGNIFQNFNLINSYTVYQNVELVLLLKGNKKNEIKQKVLDLIKKVDLYKFRNTKVSKLSGGQKQRVAIARALAKDTPIIIADEPTGNLDSRSAKGIMKLLSEISKYKLVIIVTHNYDQVEEYATRKITMHDGKVLEDKVIKTVDKVDTTKVVNYKNITFLNKIRLGFRNTFNIIPKFLLVLSVYLFIVVALIFEYSSFKKQEYLSSKEGYNYYFSDTSDKRIVVKKKDGTSFTNDDYQKLSSIYNISHIVKNDLLLDTQMNITDKNSSFWIYGIFLNKELFEGNVDVGRMPENDNEVIIEGSKDDYYLNYQKDELLKNDFYIRNIYTDEIDQTVSLKIVGIKYNNSLTSSDNKIYLSDEILKKIDFQVNQQYSKMKVLFNDLYYDSNLYDSKFRIVPSNVVNDGTVIVSNELNYSCKNENCINYPLSIEVKNLYYEDSISLNIVNTYTSKNFKKMFGTDYVDTNEGAIYISNNDYNRLFNKDPYQSSVFVNDVEKIDETISSLNQEGFSTLKISDTLINPGSSQIIQIMRTIVTLVLVIVLFFISYFVICIILKSRNVYFSTLRMLGATKKISKQLLMIELFIVSNLSYFGFILFVYLSQSKMVKIDSLKTVIDYMKFKDYVILYIILMLMSYLISQKFSKKLFKKSAISTIKEEM